MKARIHRRSGIAILAVSMLLVAGLDLLARHRIREGLPLCLDIIDIQRWNTVSYTHLRAHET